jgi:formate dehydrogenase major subunit
MTNSFGEFADAKMFLCIGTNMTEAHPVASTFLKNALARGAKLVVVDPRKQPLAKLADIHCQIKVGSDIAFLNGLMNVIITENLYDKDFVENRCDNFEAFKKKIMEYPVGRAADISGVDADTIKEVAHMLAEIKPAMLCYTLGITEHTTGKDNVMSTANLQLLLGNMGMPSAGVNPLRGQNNVQGACDMGALPNVFPGYQKVIDPAMTEKFAKAWGVQRLPNTNGIMMPQMMEGLVDKKIRAFYVFGENLANTEPDIRKVEHELSSAEFLVCQDIFPTETTRFAHVVLPAAAWSEDDGTFASSERRVNRVRKVKSPPGNAKPNWWIFKELARRMGHDWPSNSSREIWDNEVSVLAPGLAGIKYDRIEKDGLQWPCPTREHPGTQFLHRDGVFSHGKGIFNPVDWKPPAEVADAEYPLVLSTGRRLYHYHTRTQTGRSGLNFLMSEETVDMSEADAKKLGIAPDEYVKVRSRRGEVKVKARITPQVPEGMVWMSFHFRDGSANWLTNAVYDPNTLTAEYKACAVAIERL